MMNLRSPILFAGRRWFYAALLGLLVLSPGASRAEEQRWLLVFNTSASMKKRLPAVMTEIQTLLKTDFAVGLHEGDSLGVWTFDDKLQMGKFPLVTWQPWELRQVTTNLMNFVRKQTYSGTTSFAALQPTLGSVIEDSERLTVVLICDGEDEIHGTPYDDGMNETLKQTRDDRKKLQQPYVIVLRTQLGKYTGATVNFPPLAANLPPFPMLPREIKAMAPPPAPVVAPPKPVIAPPLVIVGTRVSSDTNDVAKYLATNQPPVAPEKSVATSEPMASVPPVPSSVPPTSVAPVVTAPVVAPRIVSAPPVSTPVIPVPAPVAVATVTNVPVVVTNVVAATSPPPEDRDTRILTYVGVGLLGAAIALVIFLIAVRRPAANQSLITSSMQNNPRPPEQK